ncbi:LamG-like jellyroll fold domain-containing protein [Streptomyces virginiae]|uniref:LamG-like jellyroll fold domain-containing protein n=1 Tax=Streptomyces virginiae TaxID=1961 RepID=UPI0034430B13
MVVGLLGVGTKVGGVVLGQGAKGNTSLLVFPNHGTDTWEFGLANPNAVSWPYDTTAQTNSAARIAFGTWTRLAAVYDHTTGQMRLYVNGALAGNGHHSASAGPAPAAPSPGAGTRRATPPPASPAHQQSGGLSLRRLRHRPRGHRPRLPERGRRRLRRHRHGAAARTRRVAPAAHNGGRLPASGGGLPASGRRGGRNPSKGGINTSGWFERPVTARPLGSGRASQLCADVRSPRAVTPL